MKTNLTWIVPVLDESGSMQSIKKDTIGSYNQFIDEQKKVEGEAYVAFYKFNSTIQKVFESNIQSVELLNEKTYVPAHMTRLYDAVGQAIKETKDKIKALPEDERPEKVLFVIITDGEENSSREYNREKVFEMISKREKKGWAFLYLGANQDAMKEGGKIGVNKFNTVTWTADSIGVNNAFMATSNYATKYRKAKSSAELSSLDLNQEYKDVENKS
jgi:hypothetical protein